MFAELILGSAQRRQPQHVKLHALSIAITLLYVRIIIICTGGTVEPAVRCQCEITVRSQGLLGEVH